LKTADVDLDLQYIMDTWLTVTSLRDCYIKTHTSKFYYALYAPSGSISNKKVEKHWSTCFKSLHFYFNDGT